MKKKKQKNTSKEYSHIAVNKKTKDKFEKTRFKLIGELEEEMTHDDFINYLLDLYENRKN